MYFYAIWYSENLILCIKKRLLNKKKSSTSKRRLMKKINYAKQFVGISDEESKTSIHSRRFLLFNYTDILVKNKSSQDFDIIIGVLDRARYANWSFFIVYRYYKEKYRLNNIGLYRDDSLTCFENIVRSKAKHIRSNN